MLMVVKMAVAITIYWALKRIIPITYTAVIIGFLCTTTAKNAQPKPSSNPAADQLQEWQAAHEQQSQKKATSFLGSLAPSLTASLTTDPMNGPVLLHDTNFIEIMSHFDRERIPERVVHAKGTGAHGIFTLTHDITQFTKAKVFSKIGKVTKILIRFSQVAGEAGSADTINDTRGFAIKFYTEDGNWDLVGNNLPVFFVRDPILFSPLIHSRKRNPATHLPDKTALWDFVSLRPESTHHTLQQFSDLGIPASHRTMNGFGVHAFKMINAKGEVHFVKFHLKTLQGVKNFFWDEAVKIAGENPDYYIQDLYNAIETKNYPSWEMHIQVMTPEQAKEWTGGTFDPTKIWPEDEFPLIPVGILTLNRNPKSFFAEIEQAAFDPGNLVPGISISPDRLLQGRSFSYSDTQRYRLGSNFLTIPINRPRGLKKGGRGVHNYMRDGQNCMENQLDGPNYFPNSFGGPRVLVDPEGDGVPGEFVEGFAHRTDSGKIGDNFSQPKVFYAKLSEDEKKRLASNIVRSLRLASKSVQEAMLANVFVNVNSKLHKDVKTGLSNSKIQ